MLDVINRFDSTSYEVITPIITLFYCMLPLEHINMLIRFSV